VPHEFLLHSDWRSYRVNPHPIGVPECVRTDVADAAFLPCPIQLTPESSVRVWQPGSGLF
jgi:hypothetical protein